VVAEVAVRALLVPLVAMVELLAFGQNH